jgi:AMP-polyphosphate phosphotransferase
MLEQINLDQSLSKAEYKRLLPELENKLYDLEHGMYEAKIPTMIVFEGWAAAGKGSTINVLSQRLDPRGFRVVPIMPPRTYEMQYPWLWRFWQSIPAYGQMVVYDTSWYRRVLIDHIKKQISKVEWQNSYQDIHDFEEQLANDGTVILKFWLHISKEEQARRFKSLLKHKLTRWQVSDEDAVEHAAYDKYLIAVEEMLARTDAAHAPWVIVEATDRYFTRVKVLQTIIRALENRLDGNKPNLPPPTAPEIVAKPVAKKRPARKEKPHA